MPDFASSLESVQLQRGVGTSTNGSGAFGASLNMLTDSYAKESNGKFRILSEVLILETYGKI
jgi:iron complex outermembrane receptor protein